MAKGYKTGGRKKGIANKTTAEIREIAQKYSPEAVHELAKLAGLVEGATPAQSEQARIAALTGILDRGHGKPAQGVQINPDENGEAGPVRIEFAWAGSKNE